MAEGYTRADLSQQAREIGPESQHLRQEIDRSEDEAVELLGRKRFFALRDVWSRWIVGWISASIAMNIVLTILVGLDVLHYEKYQWFINAVTVESFIQVVGLGYVAVRYLFSPGLPAVFGRKRRP